MRQDFSGVDANQLGMLFPIILEEYNPEYPKLYQQEAETIRILFGAENIVRISHIGSTAVPGLLAKPTVDLLVEIRKETDIPALSEKMRDEGYIINMPQRDVIAYMKGYTPQGFRGQVCHVHVRHSGDWDEPYFRDYLIAHPDTAKEYRGLKLRLKERYPHDRDAYTEAKGDFVQKITKLARLEFPGKYCPN